MKRTSRPAKHKTPARPHAPAPGGQGRALKSAKKPHGYIGAKGAVKKVAYKLVAPDSQLQGRIERGKVIPAGVVIKRVIVKGQPAKIKATTLRLEPALQSGLGVLRQVDKRPVNQLVNEAVREYLDRRTSEVEADLEAILARVKAYRKLDPGNQQAWNAFVQAEVAHGGADPAEGELEEVGPVQSQVQDLLRG